MKDSKSDGLRERVKAVMASNPSFGRVKIAKILGVNPNGEIRTVMAQLKLPPSIPADCLNESESAVFSGNTGEISTRRKNVRNLKELLDYMKVDLNVWRVDRHVINKWEVGAKNAKGDIVVEPLYQVKAWLSLNQPTILETALDRIEKRLAHKSVKIPKLKAAGDHLLEIALYDAHFGLLAWAKETGEDYDLKIAEARYMAAANELLSRSKGFNIERILFPIGNDFFHVNNPENVTPTAHNVLDVDGRLAKVIEHGQAALIRAIDECSKVAPVDVLWVPGNHDPQTSYFLCRIIDAWFRNNENVNVDVSPRTRKYFRYGSTLLGFTHGNEERHGDLPTVMASECREDWAKARHFEWHIGHYHKRREMRYSAGDTFGVVRVKTIPSIAGTDAWHFKKGYVEGSRVADAFIYNRDTGPVATFTCRDLRGLTCYQ